MTDFQGLNVGCGPHRTDLPGWLNTDVIREPGHIEPDVVVTPDDPIPFPAYSFDRIYMGHVLEHVPWEKTVNFLKLVKEALKSGGELMVVCPDINRALVRYLTSDDDLDWYKGVLEDDMHYQQTPTEWFGARHCWNAYEERVVRVVELAGFHDVRAIDINDPVETFGWPIVSKADGQCAVKATPHVVK